MESTYGERMMHHIRSYVAIRMALTGHQNEEELMENLEVLYKGVSHED